MDTSDDDYAAMAELDKIDLKHGSHESADDGMCAMEAVSFLAGEPFSDSPACADPGIANIMRRLNDRMPTDEMRNELLRPLLPRLIGSRTDSREVRQKRAFIAVDMACRVFAPMALEARGKLDLAKELRALTEITDHKTAIEARDKCRSAAYAAAAAYASASASAAAYAAAAYAAAAYAADAADAAAYTAAYAADAAAYAYAAASDAAARRSVFVEAVRMVIRMLDVK